jgi:hypothetical protein
MPKPQTIRDLLAEGRPLARGRVCEVAALVRARLKKVDQLIECLWDEDPGVSSRAADALERVSYHLPSILESWKAPLLGLLAEGTHKKLRWNLALIVPRLALTIPECRSVAETLQSWQQDASSIVKTCALQGLADLTRQDPSLLPSVVDLLRIHGRTGTAAMRARSRILLNRLESK